ncbi:MAG: hypothetical protein RBU37_26065 [Myxococcota bacterium]|nr:hypothetical protein [Myxococcota bacterium]
MRAERQGVGSTHATLRHAVVALVLFWGTVSALPSMDQSPQRSGELFELLCKDVKPCQIQTIYDAGKSPDGNVLQVVEVGLHAQADGGRSPLFEPLPSGEFCHTNQYWLVEHSKVPKTKLLLELCNDGYGASGVGEDTITVTDNRLEHRQYGGSAQRWSTATTWQLVPLRIVSEEADSFFSWNPDLLSSRRWSWEQFQGSGSSSLPLCGATEGEEQKLVSFEFAYLPALPAWEWKESWKELGLGQCSLRVDSTGAGGFITHGEAGEAADAAFSALLVGEDVLLVELRDDKWVSGSKNWLHDDHLELWMVPSGELPYADCHTPKTGQVYQWGIMMDGTVHAAHGKPETSPTVEASVVKDGPVRLRIKLPSAFDALTVVLSDGDDGKTQERLLASSRLVFGEAQSLGQVYRLGEGASKSCVLTEKTLEPQWSVK